MLRRTFCCLALLLASSSGVASAIELDFGNVAGALLHFDGHDHFSFTASTLVPNVGQDFQIVGSDSVSQDSLLDKGTITGTFGFTPSGNVSNVTGSGTITIVDSHNIDLTANLDWKTIAVSSGAGNLNVNGVVNLSNVSYSGSQTDLQALATGAMPTATMQFNVKSTQDLAYLGGGVSHVITDVRAYNGALTAVPEPGTIAMLFAGLPALGLVFARCRRKVAA